MLRSTWQKCFSHKTLRAVYQGSTSIAIFCAWWNSTFYQPLDILKIGFECSLQKYWVMFSAKNNRPGWGHEPHTSDLQHQFHSKQAKHHGLGGSVSQYRACRFIQFVDEYNSRKSLSLSFRIIAFNFLCNASFNLCRSASFKAVFLNLSSAQISAEQSKRCFTISTCIKIYFKICL